MFSARSATSAVWEESLLEAGLLSKPLANRAARQADMTRTTVVHRSTVCTGSEGTTASIAETTARVVRPAVEHALEPLCFAIFVAGTGDPSELAELVVGLTDGSFFVRKEIFSTLGTGETREAVVRVEGTEIFRAGLAGREIEPTIRENARREATFDIVRAGPLALTSITEVDALQGPGALAVSNTRRAGSH